MNDRRPRRFDIARARRSSLYLSIGIFGPSGSGKTFSAHRVAAGMASVVGGPVKGIDTENRRMSHYADRFQFDVIDMQPPFDPMSYADAAWACVNDGAKIIIIDSGSHEYTHVNNWHNSELSRLAGSDETKRRAWNFAAWIEPKRARKAMIDEFLRLPAHVIWCFRAGKELDLSNPKRPTDKGWQPKTSDDLIYEMTATALLLPNANGVPTWNPATEGERQMVKNPEQFKALFAKFEGTPFCEEMGAEMARWAMGDGSPVPERKKTRQEVAKEGHDAVIAGIAEATTHTALDRMAEAANSWHEKRFWSDATRDGVLAAIEAKRDTLAEGA